MKKHLIGFVILLFFSNIYSQTQLNDEDWINILSGKIESYKDYNINSIRFLTSNSFVRNEIIHDAENQTLTVKNRNYEYQYKYDEYNRIIQLNNKEQSHNFTYFDSIKKIKSYNLKLDRDSVIISQTISYPYEQYPEIKWIEILKYSKGSNDPPYISYSEKRVLDFKDSLNGYYEKILEGDIYRYYFSGDTEEYDSKQNKYIYKSLRTNPNGRETGKIKIVKGDSIYEKIIKMDTIYESDFIKDKLYNLKIRYGKDLVMREEYGYEPKTGKLIESRKYIYFPYNNTQYLMLWEIQTVNHIDKRTTNEFPNRKDYKFRRNQIFEKKGALKRRLKKEKENQGYGICGTESFKAYYYSFFASSSILVDSGRLNDRLDDLDYDYYFDDIQGYIHLEFYGEDDLKFEYLFPEERSYYKIETAFPSRMYDSRVRIRSAYPTSTIEVITNNGKKWTTNALNYYDKVNKNFDLFLFREK